MRAYARAAVESSEIATDSSARWAWVVTEPGPRTTTGTPRSRATYPPSQAAVQPPNGRSGPPASTRAASVIADQVGIGRGLEGGHLHRHLEVDRQPAVLQPERRDAVTEIVEYGGRRLAGEQPAIGDDHALGRDDRAAGAAVDLTDAPGRRAEQGMGVGGKHRVQAFDLGDDRGRAVDRVRAVGRVARVTSTPVDLDAQVGVAARSDDRLQVGRLGGDAPDEAGRLVSATYARMPLPVSSSSTTAASSTGPLSPAPRSAASATSAAARPPFMSEAPRP